MKLSKYAKHLGLCYRTAWDMFHRGEILGAYALPSGTIIVPNDIIQSPTMQAKSKKVCIYARVSSAANRKNLNEQAKRLEAYCIANGWIVDRIVKETASGINDKRTRLISVIQNLEKYDLVVVEHKDRLTRMGFNYFETFAPGKFHVVNNTEDRTEDLTNDLVAIITSFCARLYGHRRGRRKTESLIQELNREIKDDTE